MKLRTAQNHLYLYRMAQRRSDTVDAAHSGVYHCTSRCVRRERLLSDPRRRAWIVARLEFLASYAAIDVIAFGVMTNHLHLVLRTKPELVATLSDPEVAQRRVSLIASHRMHSKSSSWDDQTMFEREIAVILSSSERIRDARRDLSSPSFFHKLLKEPCAKKWNREDDVTGHYWEGRFHCKKVLDQAALEIVVMYVELNEVRAGAATSIPSSIFTSGNVQWQRLSHKVRIACEESAAANEDPCPRLLEICWEPVFPCRNAEGDGSKARVQPAMFADEFADRAPSLLRHIQRMDQVGRRRRPDKAGWISKSQPDAVSEAIARVLPSLLRGTRAVRRAARSIANWWRELRGPIEEQFDPIPVDNLAWNVLGSMRGSCYGSKESVAREAARRGQHRMVPVWSSE